MMWILLIILTCFSCFSPSSPSSTKKQTSDADASTEAFASTYKIDSKEPLLIQHATLLNGRGLKMEDTDLLIQNGKIEAIGNKLSYPNVRSIDASGKWLTPGIIDAHSHMGVYAAPEVDAHDDGNEATSPITSDVWAEHSVWPQDPQFSRALQAGVTSMLILPGSANLIGGRGVVLKNIPYVRSVEEMKFPGAPHSLKMACGENPKRVYGKRNQMPSTRMGNMAVMRRTWIDAQEYAKKRKDKKEIKRDLRLETLADVLDGKILVQNHCYRADEMILMLDLAKEFNFKISTFHHAVEAYKIADILAQSKTCAAVWSDWWGFKMEAFDTIKENAAFVDAIEGGCAIIHSDSPVGIQRLNQEAAKVMTNAKNVGLSLTPEKVMTWLTYNPAKAIGTDKLTGSLEIGKMADLVVWNQNPMSVYAKAEKVFIDGVLRFDRSKIDSQPRSDFEVNTHAN